MNPLAFLSPYKTLIEALAFAAILAGVAFGIHEFLEHEREIGRNEIRAQWNAQKLVDQKAAADKTAEWSAQLATATAERTLYDQRLQALADALGTTSGSLRDAIAARRSGLGVASLDASRATADTFAALFGDCQSRYGALAAIADRHVGDVKALTAAWPK